MQALHTAQPIGSASAPDERSTAPLARLDTFSMARTIACAPIGADTTSEGFQAVLNRHKWAFDRLAEVTKTIDDLPRRSKKARRLAEQEEEAALDEEDAALMALCSHRCTTIEEFRKKSEYFTLPHIFEGLQKEQFLAILGVEGKQNA